MVVFSLFLSFLYHLDKIHFHTPRLDFHTVSVHFHTIQLSALHYIRCVLALYCLRLNRINSAREPCLFGSGAEFVIQEHYTLMHIIKQSIFRNRETYSYTFIN